MVVPYVLLRSRNWKGMCRRRVVVLCIFLKYAGGLSFRFGFGIYPGVGPGFEGLLVASMMMLGANLRLAGGFVHVQCVGLLVDRMNLRV